MCRAIIITPVLNGFVCGIGCQTVVFNDTKTMLAEIGKYYAKPDETEAVWLKKALNNVNMGPVPMPPPEDAQPYTTRGMGSAVRPA